MAEVETHKELITFYCVVTSGPRFNNNYRKERRGRKSLFWQVYIYKMKNSTILSALETITKTVMRSLLLYDANGTNCKTCTRSPPPPSPYVVQVAMVTNCGL